MPAIPVPPGRRTVGKFGVVLLLLIFSALALLDVAAMVSIWPDSASTADGQPGANAPANPAPQPSATAAGGSATPKNACADPMRKRVVFGFLSTCISEEQRLLLLVLLAGALGGVIHAIRSLGWYVGNRKLVWSWAPWYALLPLLGSLVALVFYLVIRGGFFSPQASAQAGTPNVFGFVAFSALIGMFTNQAVAKLKETFEALLAAHEEGKDRIASAVSIKELQPNQGPQAGGTAVTITGTGFTADTRVKFGAQLATQVTFNSATEIVATTPPQAAGAVDVELVNPDNQNAVARQAFTYV
jgi:IPT/TIG domain